MGLANGGSDLNPCRDSGHYLYCSDGRDPVG